MAERNCQLSISPNCGQNATGQLAKNRMSCEKQRRVNTYAVVVKSSWEKKILNGLRWPSLALVSTLIMLNQRMDAQALCCWLELEMMTTGREEACICHRKDKFVRTHLTQIQIETRGSHETSFQEKVQCKPAGQYPSLYAERQC